MATENAECFSSCNEGAFVNGCDFFCGTNPVERLKVVWRLFCLLFPHKQKLLMPNIGAFLRCHEKSQKNDKNLPHIACSSVRGHMMSRL